MQHGLWPALIFQNECRQLRIPEIAGPVIYMFHKRFLMPFHTPGSGIIPARREIFQNKGKGFIGTGLLELKTRISVLKHRHRPRE